MLEALLTVFAIYILGLCTVFILRRTNSGLLQEGTEDDEWGLAVTSPTWLSTVTSQDVRVNRPLLVMLSLFTAFCGFVEADYFTKIAEGAHSDVFRVYSYRGDSVFKVVKLGYVLKSWDRLFSEILIAL
ncbi:unnamed protein product [Ixodes persulcatus]